MRLARCLLISGSAAVMVGSLVLGGEAAVTSMADGGHARPAGAGPSASFLAAARTALVGYLRTSRPQIVPVRPGGPDHRAAGTFTKTGATTAAGAYNWSGYADVSGTAGTFTQVSGQWRTPSVRCTREDEITSDWVGLDGFSDNTVEQDGTASWCFEGTPTYFTWYEMYPAGTVEVGTSLAPGDKITASVTRASTKYTLKLTDATNTANSFSKSATCALATCLDESAEWIAERSSFAIGIAPLANYGTWKLTSGAETAGGTVGTIGSYSTVEEFTMVDATDSYNLSTPSTLTGGKAFSTKWDNSY